VVKVGETDRRAALPNARYGPGRQSRRRFLANAFTTGAATLIAPQLVGLKPAPRIGAGPLAPQAGAAPFPDWARMARVADASFGENPDPSTDLQPLIDALRAQNVSVAETDTILSNWLTPAQFTAHMSDIKLWVDLAHLNGLKVVMYYPSLEVISPGGLVGPSFYKNDMGRQWAQVGISGRPNVFYGNLVFWVGPNDESCWVSPNSPWRELYLGRIKELAATGADGIWPDVPIYFDGVEDWCDTSSFARAAFTASTGLDIPTNANTADPAFRRFVEWRHRNLSQFQLDIAAAARSVNPTTLVFVETVTMDYQWARLIGLDGGYLRQADNITQVWEVDVLSNSDAMRFATATDWICLISMYKYARGASGGKPAWVFDYGKRADDASLVMAEALAAGCNPFEVQVPGKTVGVDAAMRTRMYGFVQQHQDRLFTANALAKVALYHSSASRDFVKPTPGTGLYANAISPAGAADWWGRNDPDQSCLTHQWLAEFRGMVKVLVHSRTPFEVVTSPGLVAGDLSPYVLVVCPDLEAISDAEAAIFREYVRGGGSILISGPNPTGSTALGDPRSEFALADVLGFSATAPLPSSKLNRFGLGTCMFFSDLPGGDYLRSDLEAAYTKLTAQIQRVVPAFVTLSGDRRVHLEARQLGNDMILQLTNFTNLGAVPASTFTTLPTGCTLAVTIPAGTQVAAVQVSSPDAPSSAFQAVPYSVASGTATFSLSVVQYSLVVLTLR
jgi:hypothetical protein